MASFSASASGPLRMSTYVVFEGSMSTSFMSPSPLCPAAAKWRKGIPAGRPSSLPCAKDWSVAGSAESVLLDGGIRAEAENHEIGSGREKLLAHVPLTGQGVQRDGRVFRPTASQDMDRVESALCVEFGKLQDDRRLLPFLPASTCSRPAACTCPVSLGFRLVWNPSEKKSQSGYLFFFEFMTGWKRSSHWLFSLLLAEFR